MPNSLFSSVILAATLAFLALPNPNLRAAEASAPDSDQIQFGGDLKDQEAQFTFSGHFKGRPSKEHEPIYSSRASSSGTAEPNAFIQTIEFEANLVSGEFAELELAMRGEGEVTQVKGEKLQNWSIRRDHDGNRSLILRVDHSQKDLRQLKFQIETRQEFQKLPVRISPLIVVPGNPAMHEGLLRFTAKPALRLQVLEAADLTPVSPLPAHAVSMNLSPSPSPSPGVDRKSDSKTRGEESGTFMVPGAETLAFRFFATLPKLTLELTAADPDANRVIFEQFSLNGQLLSNHVAFVLKGVARLKNPKGGELLVLSGRAALTDLISGPGYRIEYREPRFYFVKAGDTLSAIAQGQGTSAPALTSANSLSSEALQPGQRLLIPRPGFAAGYYLVFDRPGEFPIELKFDARITEQDGWRSLDFEVAPSSMRPVSVSGLPANIEFRSTTLSKPKQTSAAFEFNLPAAGRLAVSWKETRPEAEGRLFYSLESLAEISVSPGLLRQTHLFDVKVTQGEITRLILNVEGNGEITRVTGPDILSWKVTGSDIRRQLAVELNQAKKSDFAIAVYTQTPLGPFPLAVTPLRLRPENAIRFGGYLRLVNDGAGRLDVTKAAGLSQISAAQFPQTQAVRTLTDQSGMQIFAYRFSDGNYELAVQADNILPELSVSELLVYRAAEAETSIEAEIELDIREAPLREFTLLIPADYILSQLNNAHLSDYFVTKENAGGPSRLRIVFSGPVSGHEIIQVRLENNRTLQPGNWPLPRLQPEGVKSVRGYVGIAADAGLRLTAVNANESLSEVGPAFFPRKAEGLQLAWRLRDGNWSVTARIERLQLSMQVDALHLFSIGEGIAYGSSVMKYFISGSPVPVLKFRAPTNYSNIEFTGRDVRGWRNTGGGQYEVSLNSPVFGAYTVLATYDRQFPPAGGTLSFEGVQPEGVQSEQGRVIVISDFQFQVRTATNSPGLIALDPTEIPAEDRLLFAAPVLASYQYLARPFRLDLQLAALTQGETMNLVIDRASVQSRISSEGNALTEITYLLKSKGHSHLRLTLPAGVELWSSMVNGARVVPVADGKDTLVPLPQHSDPDAVITLAIKIAAKSPDARSVQLQLPVAAAPILQTDWRVDPEANHQLIFRQGSVRPAIGGVEWTGYEWLHQLLTGKGSSESVLVLVLAAVLLAAGLLLVRWATGAGRSRGDWRNIIGLTAATVAFALALVLLVSGAVTSSSYSGVLPNYLSFTMPVLEAGRTAAIQINNFEIGGAWHFISKLWPLLLALVVWLWQFRFSPGFARKALVWIGWIFVFWAALRAPDSGRLFRLALATFAFIHLILPAWGAQRRLPRSPGASPASPAMGGAVALLVAGCFAVPLRAGTLPADQPVVISSIDQSAQIRDNGFVAHARIKWTAQPGQWLDFLRQPAVLTHIDYPTNQVTLLESRVRGATVYRLTARSGGTFEAQFDYQLPINPSDAGPSVRLPTHYGLVNRLSLDIPDQDVEVSSPQAVAVERKMIQRDNHETTHAELVLEPSDQIEVNWRPRRRDIRAERAVFYVEMTHLFIPGAGVIEGIHDASIRLAQGQLAGLEFSVPPEFTITDAQAPFVSTWRFDPESRTLRVQFKSPQSGVFALRATSQVAVRPLPYQQRLALPAVSGAANQLGSAGLATGSEVQIQDVQVENLTPINLEDFARSTLAFAQSKDAAIGLRRAFRFSNPGAQLTISAAAVEPDVRVVTQETLSLAQDRTVLAINLTATITRAGVFKLSFPLPEPLEVESLTGPALSHWTELREANQRIITMHLRGKTEGRQTFALTLAGPGLTEQTLTAPRVTLREASKQTGQLIVTPELGIRLHARTRQGVTELDPKQLNIKQPGVLAFRLLQNAWQLDFEVEKVAPWLQANLLEDITVKEGQLLVVANLEYQIENAGVNALRLDLPASAESVVFNGQHITDSVKGVAGANGLATWTVKLSRRVIGTYRLHVDFKLLNGSAASALQLTGIQAQGVNLQRGHLSVRSGGRLEVSVPQLPSSLAKADWQSVPATLREGISAQEPNAFFRIVDPSFNLTLQIVRHDPAKLLPARVEKLDLSSTLSPTGELLTQAQLTLHSGDKRLLRLKLPSGSDFWFAFVNGESALPWTEGDQVLIPLEKNSDPAQPTLVELFYSTRALAHSGGFDYRLPGPAFDLPLQNITWTAYLDGLWRVTKWDDRWQLLSQGSADAAAARGVEGYLSVASARRQAKTIQAESLLKKGNEFLQKGDQQMARNAYRAALELSQHDAALNEDARVQLQTLRQQQALVGLNFLNRYGIEQRNQMPSAPNAPAFQLGKQPTYTQQQAKDFIEQTGSEDNAALMRLADRLVKQQQAAVRKVEAIHATLPQQGRKVVFTRSLQVDSLSPLEIGLDIDRSAEKRPARFWLLVVVALALGALMAVRDWSVKRPENV